MWGWNWILEKGTFPGTGLEVCNFPYHPCSYHCSPSVCPCFLLPLLPSLFRHGLTTGCPGIQRTTTILMLSESPPPKYGVQTFTLSISERSLSIFKPSSYLNITATLVTCGSTVIWCPTCHNILFKLCIYLTSVSMHPKLCRGNNRVKGSAAHLGLEVYQKLYLLYIRCC